MVVYTLAERSQVFCFLIILYRNDYSRVIVTKELFRGRINKEREKKDAVGYLICLALVGTFNGTDYKTIRDIIYQELEVIAADIA